MDNAFDKFLLDLEGEKNCLDLRRPAFNGSSEHEEVQQRGFDLECLEKELGIMQSSLDDTYVDTDQIPQLYQRAQSVVKDLEATERQVHEKNTDISLSAERITKAQKNVSVLAESFQKIVDGHPLDFDINAIFEPCLEQANNMKKNTVQLVSVAANSFDVQNLIIEIAKIVEQRKKRSNLLLERDACRSLYEETSCTLEKQNEEYVKLCTEKDQLQMDLRKKKEAIGNWANEAKRLQEQIEVCRSEVDAKQIIADQIKVEHNNILSALETCASKYLLLSEQKKQVQEKLHELKQKLSQEAAQHEENKSSFLKKVAKSCEHKQVTLADLKQRQIDFNMKLKTTQDQLNNVNRLRERFSRKEAGTNGLADKIIATREKIACVKEAVGALSAKTECYRLESERKISGRKVELLELEKQVEERQTQFVNLESEAEEIGLTINDKSERLSNLMQEVVTLENPQKTPEHYPLKPVSTSTPLTTTLNGSSVEAGTVPPKSKPGRPPKSKRGGRKRS